MSVDHRQSIVDYLEARAQKHEAIASKTPNKKLHGFSNRDWAIMIRVLSNDIRARMDIEEQGSQVRFSDIKQSVCSTFGITDAEFKGHGRGETVIWAKNAAVWLARKHLGWSYAMIGRQMGYADHSTVKDRYVDAAALLKTTPEFEVYVRRVESLLQLTLADRAMSDDTLDLTDELPGAEDVELPVDGAIESTIK